MFDRCRHREPFILRARRARVAQHSYCEISAGDCPSHSFFFSISGSLIRPEFPSPAIPPLTLLDLVDSLTEVQVPVSYFKNFLKLWKSSSVWPGYKKELTINSVWQEVMNCPWPWNVTFSKGYTQKLQEEGDVGREKLTRHCWCQRISHYVCWHCVTTSMGQGFSETCLMKRESWVKSCHGEKTQYWASSTLITALISCKQPGQVVDELVWVQLKYSRTSELTFVCVLIWFLMWVENKKGCLPISSFCKAGPLHSSFLVTLQHFVWNAAARCGWG